MKAKKKAKKKPIILVFVNGGENDESKLMMKMKDSVLIHNFRNVN